ncbi:MAG: hypothetical protein WAW79_09755 [Steroidobacteraceae bacterium]
MKPWARLPAVALACLWAVGIAAQEAPAPVPPAETPAVAAEPESVDAGAVPAEEAIPPAEAVPATAAISGAKRIVVLPVEFTVYEKSVAGLEAVPDWSESAKYALGDAAAKMLKLDDRFEIVAMPTFEGETEGLLREHVELFKIVADSVTSLLTYGGKAWHEKRTSFDYTLGDGLAFVADAAQAEYALIVAGAQVKQTGGAVFMQLLAAAGGYSAPGGGTFVVIGVVNLRSGDVAWFNWKQGVQVFGMTGSDVRDPATAAELVGKMFAEYPDSKMITFRPF